MTNPIVLEREIRDDARLLVKLDHAARDAMLDGNIQEASNLWANREVVRIRRSYLMRMLWTYHGIPKVIPMDNV